jgi:hypothetical protein
MGLEQDTLHEEMLRRRALLNLEVHGTLIGSCALTPAGTSQSSREDGESRVEWIFHVPCSCVYRWSGALGASSTLLTSS